MLKKLEIVFLAMILAGAFACALSPVWDKDSFWHIAFGRQIVETGSLVRTEPFSFVTEGRPITDLSWLPHLIFGLLYERSGFRGLEILTGFLGLLTAFFMIRTARIEYTLLHLGLYFSLFFNIFKSRIRLRPEGLSIVLFAALIYLLALYRADRLRRPLAFAALFLLWTQVHPSWIYGLVAVPWFILEKRGLKPDRNLLKDAAFMLGLPVIALFFNPYFHAPVIFPFTSFITMKLHPMEIAEWKNLTLGSLTGPFAVFLVAVAAHSVFLAARKRESVFMTAFIVMQLFFLFSWTRYLTFAMVAMLPFALRLFDAVIKPFPRYRTLFAVIALAVLLMPFLSLMTYVPTERSLSASFPEEESAFLLSNDVRGNILNVYETGGFLEFRTYPKCRIFIDGRFFDFLPYYRDMLSSVRQAYSFERFTESYPFEIAVVPYYKTVVLDPATKKERNFLSMYFPTEKWARVFYGPYGIVLLKRLPRFSGLIEKYEYRALFPYEEEGSESLLLESEKHRAQSTGAAFLEPPEVTQ